MKKISSFLLIGCMLWLISCNTNDETSNQSIQKDTLIVTDTLSNYSKSFQNIVKTTEGAFRGVNLGFDVAQVTSLEDASQKEKEPGKLEYMINFQEFESAEVNYILNKKNKVAAIEVNIYPKSKESQDSLYAEFNKYFTRKYGESTSSDTLSQKWENESSDLLIQIEKKDTQKIHDINISFSSISGQSALIITRKPV
jgi:hypothetical protein